MCRNAQGCKTMHSGCAMSSSHAGSLCKVPCLWKPAFVLYSAQCLIGTQVRNAQCFFLVWYSRNSENNTSKYPDLAADVPKLLKEGCKSVVLDCEAVAYDRITKKILPFQVSLLSQCQAMNK